MLFFARPYFLVLVLWLQHTLSDPLDQVPLNLGSARNLDRQISLELFTELEELARIVDISYCVGTTGIWKPFLCASRCHEFPDFELITTWNTGPLLADSCGYIALSHSLIHPRIIVAFRGTYSVANTIVDLSTISQEYVPYIGDDTNTNRSECTNCTVHLGFMASWKTTQILILSHLEKIVEEYPNYRLNVIGHSLGGAVAALASLDFQARGWKPKVTTFGEPRIGNEALMRYLDEAFSEQGQNNITQRYRRVTHVDDPVPLLPLHEWGYRMHAGEVHISKAELPPAISDIQHCKGDADPSCIAIGESSHSENQDEGQNTWLNGLKDTSSVQPRFRMWQLFFAHRDYFWRLGLCIPGGDPKDWYRKYSGLKESNSDRRSLTTS